MMIHFAKQWRRHHAGSDYDMPDGVANVLIRRGYAVLAADPTPVVVKRGPGRPRKVWPNEQPN